MGKWGYELYQNDTCQDVKGEFEELYNGGKTVKSITKKLTEDYESIMGDMEEEPLFWFALADTQWNLGVLLPDVKEKALFWIDKETDAAVNIQWNKTVKALKAKLISPQPPVKKVAKKRVYQCQWKIGDVFAYKLESELAKERGLYGRYFLIRKVDEGVWYPGHIVPIVYVKITKDDKLPTNVEEYNQLEYVQTSFIKYEERFFPIDMSRPKEDIEEKSKIDYQVDEYGYLPEYRVMLLNTSARIIPKKLIYIGNFKDAVCPQKEFVPHAKVNITTVAWKRFNETFETKMIKRYCGHNLRELSIYKNR